MSGRFRQFCASARRLAAARWLPLGAALLVAAGSAVAWLLWPDPDLAAAERALERRDYATASAHLEECAKRWPRDPRVLFLAASTARRAGLYPQAEEHLRACQRLQGPTDAIALERALIRVQQGDPAVEPYLKTRAERGDPDTLLIWETLIQVYVQSHRFFEALDLLDRYLERRPDDVHVLLGRGFVRERLFQYPDALKDYRLAVAAAPDDARARRRLAETLLVLGPPEEAVAEFTDLHRRQPDDADVRLGLARAHRQLGHNDEARQLLDAILVEHPEHAGALTERGRLALDEGDLARAEEWLRAAVARAPYERQALYNLYQCVQRRGPEAEARACRARFDRVDADMKRLDAISQAVLERPRDPALRCEGGEIFLRNGEEQAGLTWLNLAIRLDPNYRPAQQALAAYREQRTRRQGDQGTKGQGTTGMNQ
jgi:tetratricopeptide (TPR) repeat protein